RRTVPQIDCRNQMSKQNRKNRKSDEASERSKGEPKPKEEMSGKDYEKEVRRLHEELVSVQDWVKREGVKVCIVFEGRDGAGKGGTIKAITERGCPRRRSARRARSTCNATFDTCRRAARS